MKKRFSVRKFGLMLMMCCTVLGLTACGAGNEMVSNVALESRINEEMVYFASELDLKLGDSMADVDFKVYGTMIYYPEGQTIVTYSTEDRSKTVDTYNWADAPGQWVYERVSYGKSGEVYGVVTIGTTHYLCKFNADRQVVFAKDLTEVYQKAAENATAGSDITANTRLEVGDDGRVYLSTPGGILVFEGDGKQADNISFGNVKDVWVRDFQSDTKRNLYVLYEDNATQNQYVAEIDMEKDSVKNVQQTIGLTGIGTTETEGRLLGYSEAKVYTYYREECSLTELFHWTECKVTGEEVYSAKQLADGRILVAGKPTAGSVENFLVKGTQIGVTTVGNNTPGMNEAGKINLRLGVLVSASEELRNSVYQFNKTNPRYNVLLEQYGETRAEGIALLKAEIETGNAPDLFDVDFGEAETLASEGYLEDLFLYLEGSDKISEGDFVNFALEEYNYDGLLVAIPHQFQISVLIGNSEYVGEEPGWTLEEMVTFLEDYGVGDGSIYAEYYTTRYTVFGDMFRTNEELFVDREAGTCFFDTELFRRIVNVLADFPTEYDNSQVFATYTNLQSGKSLLSTEWITQFTSLQPYAAALSGNLTCIGYPVEEGVGVSASSSDAIGISALSEYKDGAWEFLETFLQYATVDGIGFGFPTYIPKLEKVSAWYMGHKAYHSFEAPDGFRYEYHVTTPEEVEQCLELMEVAKLINVDTDLTGIVSEEMEYYYAGEKTMDQMIADIETRVEAYLQESE